VPSLYQAPLNLAADTATTGKGAHAEATRRALAACFAASHAHYLASTAAEASTGTGGETGRSAGSVQDRLPLEDWVFFLRGFGRRLLADHPQVRRMLGPADADSSPGSLLDSAAEAEDTAAADGASSQRQAKRRQRGLQEDDFAAIVAAEADATTGRNEAAKGPELRFIRRLARPRRPHAMIALSSDSDGAATGPSIFHLTAADEVASTDAADEAALASAALAGPLEGALTELLAAVAAGSDPAVREASDESGTPGFSFPLVVHALPRRWWADSISPVVPSDPGSAAVTHPLAEEEDGDAGDTGGVGGLQIIARVEGSNAIGSGGTLAHTAAAPPPSPPVSSVSIPLLPLQPSRSLSGSPLPPPLLPGSALLAADAGESDRSDGRRTSPVPAAAHASPLGSGHRSISRSAVLPENKARLSRLNSKIASISTALPPTDLDSSHARVAAPITQVLVREVKAAAPKPSFAAPAKVAGNAATAAAAAAAARGRAGGRREPQQERKPAQQAAAPAEGSHSPRPAGVAQKPAAPTQARAAVPDASPRRPVATAAATAAAANADAPAEGADDRSTEPSALASPLPTARTGSASRRSPAPATLSPKAGLQLLSRKLIQKTPAPTVESSPYAAAGKTGIPLPKTKIPGPDSRPTRPRVVRNSGYGALASPSGKRSVSLIPAGRKPLSSAKEPTDVRLQQSPGRTGRSQNRQPHSARAASSLDDSLAAAGAVSPQAVRQLVTRLEGAARVIRQQLLPALSPQKADRRDTIARSPARGGASVAGQGRERGGRSLSVDKLTATLHRSAAAVKEASDEISILLQALTTDTAKPGVDAHVELEPLHTGVVVSSTAAREISDQARS
jgi:hypothetical protein